MDIYEILILIFSSVITFLASYKIFQIYQLSGYKTKSVVAWFKMTGCDYLLRYFAAAFLSFIGMFVFLGCFSKTDGWRYLGFVFYFLFGGMFIYLTAAEQKKTPLVFTRRVIRCLAVFFVLNAALTYALTFLVPLFEADYSLMAIGMFLVPFIVILSHIIMQPVEKAINKGYIKEAKAALTKYDGLIKIGITGSFGKTTAKNILSKILEKKYTVASSPSSFNTPIGLAKFINGGFEKGTNVFIAEMGAKNIGDIKELCDFIEPSAGLITSIGEQHLETFKSLDNIISAKYELIESLGKDGVAFFNADENGIIQQMYDKCVCKKYLSGEGGDAYYSGVNISLEGTSFDMTLLGQKISITTKLLGAHIPGLICLCALAALDLGVTAEDIAAACSEIEPVPHRLELICRGDTVVLDDAYNSNLAGAKNALEVLSKLEGTKIIITPGLVEQGEKQPQLNFELGQQTAKYADVAFFTGFNSKDLKNGAIAGGMEEKNIFVVEKLSDAVEKTSVYTGKKAILFENDLPDNF